MITIKSFTNLFENLNNDLVKCGKLPEHVAFVMDGKNLKLRSFENVQI